MCKDCKYFEYSGIYVGDGLCRASGYKMKNEIPLVYPGEDELKSKGEEIPVFSCKYHKKEQIKKENMRLKKESNRLSRIVVSVSTIFLFLRTCFKEKEKKYHKT